MRSNVDVIARYSEYSVQCDIDTNSIQCAYLVFVGQTVTDAKNIILSHVCENKRRDYRESVFSLVERVEFIK